MNIENDTETTPHKDKGCYKEYQSLASAFMVLLLLAFSLLYMSDSEEFKKTNKLLIVLIETGSATLAVIAFTLDRFKLTDNLLPAVKWALNMATLAFFLITVPHLFASSLDDALTNVVVTWVIITFYFFVLASIIFYAISLIGKKRNIITFILSILLTISVFSLIYWMTLKGISQSVVAANHWLLEKMGLGF